MGIYIRDLNLPKDNKHALWVVIHPDGTVEYDTGDYGWQTLRQSAVPVPPHGRLRDLDALRKAVGTMEEAARREYYELSDAEKECEYEQGVWDGIHMVAKMLSVAPTIIPADPVEEGDT